METITFEQLPTAFSQLFNKVENIEKLLQEKYPPQIQIEELLTIQQAGELLNLSIPTIYGLVSRCSIPVNKKGKRLYFSKQELIDWVRAGRKKTTAEIQLEAQNFIGKQKRR